MACSCDANGNVMGRTHIKSILATRICQIEFAEDKGTELATNVVAASMYTQCDADGNQF